MRAAAVRLGQALRGLALDLTHSWRSVEDAVVTSALEAIMLREPIRLDRGMEARLRDLLKETFNCDSCNYTEPPAPCRLTFKLWGLTPPCDQK